MCPAPRFNLYKAAASLCFVALVIGAVHYFALPPAYTLPAQMTDRKAAGALFARDIQAYGGRAAYARLAVALGGIDGDEQHGYAHEFGHELYVLEGEPGISVCDGRFNLGCFHQFLGDAIADLGSGAIERLYRECGDVFGSVTTCQHGLGHGVLSGLGYTEDNLKEALALCFEVTKLRGYSGCDGGVFMEYNIRTIANAEGIMGGRTPESGNVFAPCDRLASADQATCAFWLPQWWFFSIMEGQRDPAKRYGLYTQMGDDCAKSPSPQACYEGIGYITPTVFKHDPDAAREACDHTGVRAALYCRAMAALIFRNTPLYAAQAPSLCVGLIWREQAVCMLYASHEGTFSFSVPETP